MVAMAGDSYLLKVPTAPCQGQACRKAPSPRSASCGVVAYLVLLTGAVLTLTAAAYYLRLELGELRDELNSFSKDVKEREHQMHAHIDYLHSQLGDVRDKLSGMDDNLIRNLVQQFKAYENRESDEEDVDFDPHDDADDEDWEQTLPIATVRASSQERHDSVPPLEPAGQRGAYAPATSDEHSDEADLDDGENRTDEVNDGDAESGHLDRARREAVFPGTALGSRRVHGVNGEPQLKLYHMLQTPGVAAVSPPGQAEPWSYHDAHRAGRPQPMYAEHAATDFVTPPRPPRRHSTLDPSTPSTPVASMRRSRVMATAVSSQPPQRHHRNRTGRRQRLQQQQQQQQHHYGEAQLQDVSQNVVTGRSVEVGPVGSSGPRGPRGPFYRGARVTDTFHP